MKDALIAAALATVMTSLLAPVFLTHMRERSLTACSETLKLQADAVERYRRVRGHYPQTLKELVPCYLRALPACPSDAPAPNYVLESTQDACTLYCSGGYHPEAGENYPRYTSYRGLSRKR